MAIKKNRTDEASDNFTGETEHAENASVNGGKNSAGNSPARTVPKRRSSEKAAASKPSKKNTGKTGTEEKPADVRSFVEQKLAEKSAGQETLSEVPDHEALKKQFKRRKSDVPQYDKIKRYAPDVSKGLSSDEVNERFSHFLFNATNQKISKT